MRFQDIPRKITGISTPIFGISWEPPESERQNALRVLSFLEDRRVLYNPFALEDTHHCVSSVVEIRKFLTNEIGQLEPNHQLTNSLKAMRAACRKFLDRIGADKKGEILEYGNRQGHWANWVFTDALGQMRGVFGIHIALIATQYGLDIEDDLAKILPDEDEE